MNRTGKTGLKSFLWLLLGVTAGVLIGFNMAEHDLFHLSRDTTDSHGADSAATRKPLYWVAPMDPNYRRDKPGKSPMGMDLVPIYANQPDEDAAGTVRISPHVVHNLGVRTSVVTRGSLAPEVTTVGYIQYDEDYLHHIHPRVEGWIEKLWVEAAGDPVAAGEPLYSIYSPTLVNAQEELVLALNRKNPALLNAALERLHALEVPDSEIERIKSTNVVSQNIVVRAPQSGVVDELSIREGMYVKPGMEMMSIGRLERLWVIGEVFEREVSDVRVGDEVVLTLDYLPARKWRGAIDYIYPKLDTKTRTARVRVQLENSDGALRPGMFTEVKIKTKPHPPALLIPREALIRTGDQARVVMQLEEGTFKSVDVQVGQMAGDQVEIFAGLNPGDRIVTSAQFLIDSESSKTSDFRRLGIETNNPSLEPGTADHGAMDHSTMDHGTMNHGTMDHGAMDHEGMNHGASGESGKEAGVDAGGMDHSHSHSEPQP